MELEQQKEDLTIGMSDYALMELANSTLNRLIAYCAVQERIERKKENPDVRKLLKLNALCIKCSDINRNNENFLNEDKLRDIVNTYTPLLKKLVKGEVSVYS